MFTGKNLTPGSLALLVSVVIGLSTGLYLIPLGPNITYGFAGVLSISLITYALIRMLVERFVYRRIKLIYKFISQTKASQREEFYQKTLLPRQTIDEVGEEVVRWAEERKGEIERLQHNEQYRREFLMNLAHELKTPIFSAQGYIETLLQGAMHDESVSQTFLEKASRSIDRLSDLVNDLDEISKLESNRLPIHKQYFIMQDLIRDVFDELSQKAGRKGIRLSIKKGCEQDIRVYADHAKLKQVLVNLIDNSISYGRVNGETTAGVYIVDSKLVYTEITDDGIGIQEDQIARVFERFFRTDTARSRNAGGTGLGLAIVKHIIEAHGHSVHCRSKLDVGTSFGFTLDREAD